MHSVRTKKKRGMLSAILLVCGLLVGHFPGVPPRAEESTSRASSSVARGVVVPTHRAFYACVDDRGAVHYLVHHGHVLLRCVWTTPMPTSRKMRVFREVRTWAAARNATLLSSLTDELDASAFHFSIL